MWLQDLGSTTVSGGIFVPPRSKYLTYVFFTYAPLMAILYEFFHSANSIIYKFYSLLLILLIQYEY